MEFRTVTDWLDCFLKPRCCIMMEGNYWQMTLLGDSLVEVLIRKEGLEADLVHSYGKS